MENEGVNPEQHEENPEKTIEAQTLDYVRNFLEFKVYEFEENEKDTPPEGKENSFTYKKARYFLKLAFHFFLREYPHLAKDVKQITEELSNKNESRLRHAVSLKEYLPEDEYRTNIRNWIEAVLDLVKKDVEKITKQKDYLTGAYKREFALDFIANSLERKQRYESCYPGAIVMIDIDHFKSVNDTYGHPFGDKVLRELVIFLQKNLRLSDIVARYGGEEFIIYMPRVESLEAIYKVMKRLREAAQSLQVETDDEELVDIRFSAGVRIVGHGNSNVDELIKQADTALYEAKKNGRNRFTVFESEGEKNCKGKSE